MEQVLMWALAQKPVQSTVQAEEAIISRTAECPYSLVSLDTEGTEIIGIIMSMPKQKGDSIS